jgi:hypothetical protein
MDSSTAPKILDELRTDGIVENEKIQLYGHSITGSRAVSAMFGYKLLWRIVASMETAVDEVLETKTYLPPTR